MADVFISYKSEERDRLAPLAAALRDAGFSVWWDHALIVGQDYSLAIAAEIAAARVVIPVWTIESVSSHWVSAEADLGSGKLFPIRLDVVTPPLPYNKLHTLDLTGWRGATDDPRWRRLVADLRAKIDGLPSEPPPFKSRGSKSLIPAIYAGASILIPLMIIFGFIALADISSPPEMNGGGFEQVAARSSNAADEPGTRQTGSVIEEARRENRNGEVPSIEIYGEAEQALRENAETVSLDLCMASPPSRCGIRTVRVGEIVTVQVTSSVAGRLILMDVNSRGERTQIFPNGLSESGRDSSLLPGEMIRLPLPEHGFVFGVSEPVGPSHIVAIVLPEEASAPTIVIENARTRGLSVIPAGRADEFAEPIATALAEDPRRIAFGELSYQVTR